VDYRSHLGVTGVNRLVQAGRPAGSLAGLDQTVADQDEIGQFGSVPIEDVGGNQKRIRVDTGRKAAFRANQQAIAVTAVQKVAKLPAEFLFMAAGRWHFALRPGERRPARKGDLLVGQIPNRPQSTGLDDGFGSKLERFETLKGILQIGSADNDAVIFQNHCEETLVESCYN